MLLHQEYLSRHKLKKVFAPQQCDDIVLFFKDKTKSCKSNSVLKLKWTPPDYHPGRFKGCILMTHPSSSFKETDKLEFGWDGYESHLYKLIGKEIPSSPDSVYVHAWQMLVYMLQKNLSKYANYDDFFGSIDDTLSLKKRRECIDRVFGIIDKQSADVRKFWDRHINEAYIMRYSYVLAEEILKFQDA